MTLVQKWSVDSETGDGRRLFVGPKHVFATAHVWDSVTRIGLTAIDKETGQVAWKKPLVRDAFPYKDLVVTWRPFQVLDAATGKQLWTRPGIMNYMDVAATDELLAFISLERKPLRYRLTVAELRTGRELFHTEVSGVNMKAFESRAALSFDRHGLWVAHKRIPDDPDERAKVWAAVVLDSNVGSTRFPCRTVGDDRHVLTRGELGAISFWDRSASDSPLWTSTPAEEFYHCASTRLLLDNERVFRGEERTIFDDDRTHIVKEFLALTRHSPKDGSVIWRREIHRSRNLKAMSFGLMLPGDVENERIPAADGPAALDNDGNEIEVVGYLPPWAVTENDVIYARDKGTVMRLEVRTEP